MDILMVHKISRVKHRHVKMYTLKGIALLITVGVDE